LLIFLAIIIGAYPFSEGSGTILNDLAGGVGNAKLGKIFIIIITHFLQGSSTNSIPDAYSPEWIPNVILHLLAYFTIL